MNALAAGGTGAGRALGVVATGADGTGTTGARAGAAGWPEGALRTVAGVGAVEALRGGEIGLSTSVGAEEAAGGVSGEVLTGAAAVTGAGLGVLASKGATGASAGALVSGAAGGAGLVAAVVDVGGVSAAAAVGAGALAGATNAGAVARLSPAGADDAGGGAMGEAAAGLGDEPAATGVAGTARSVAKVGAGPAGGWGAADSGAARVGAISGGLVKATAAVDSAPEGMAATAWAAAGCGGITGLAKPERIRALRAKLRALEVVAGVWPRDRACSSSCQRCPCRASASLVFTSCLPTWWTVAVLASALATTRLKSWTLSSSSVLSRGSGLTWALSAVRASSNAT